MTEKITEAEFEAAMERAQELSDYFREIGMEYDEKNTFAYPTIERFKAADIGRIAIPKEYGGLGGDLIHTSKIITKLSEGDSAIALAYNMH